MLSEDITAILRALAGQGFPVDSVSVDGSHLRVVIAIPLTPEEVG